MMPGRGGGPILAYALSRRAALSWAAVGLSLACQLSAGIVVAAGAGAGPRLAGMPVAFAVALAASLVLTVGMFVVRTARNFRDLLAPRSIVLGVLLALPREVRGLELLLTLPLIFEISIAERYPSNLAVDGAAIAPAGGCGWLLVTGLPKASWNAAFLQADWIAVSVFFAATSSLLLHYREQSLQREQERRRLDAAVGELAKANLGYQEFAAVLEQRTMVEERRRITRDIHDIIGYNLTNNIMMMEAAVEMVRRDPQRVSTLITEARRNAEEGLDGVRNALYLLRAQETPVTSGMDLLSPFGGCPDTGAIKEDREMKMLLVVLVTGLLVVAGLAAGGKAEPASTTSTGATATPAAASPAPKDPFGRMPEPVVFTTARETFEDPKIPPGEDLENNDLVGYVEKTINVRPKIIWTTSSQNYAFEAKINLLIASRDIPDVLEFRAQPQGMAILKKLVSNEMIMDLSQVVADYASASWKDHHAAAGNVAIKMVTFGGTLMAMPSLSDTESSWPLAARWE